MDAAGVDAAVSGAADPEPPHAARANVIANASSIVIAFFISCPPKIFYYSHGFTRVTATDFNASARGGACQAPSKKRARRSRVMTAPARMVVAVSIAMAHSIISARAKT